MASKNKHLNKLADSLLKNDDLFQKLKSLGARKNYTSKLQKLEKKISQQVELFERKEHTGKLVDLKKDLKFVLTQLSSGDVDKGRVDLLANKYSIDYGEGS